MPSQDSRPRSERWFLWRPDLALVLMFLLAGCGRADGDLDPSQVSIHQIGDTITIESRRPATLDTGHLVQLSRFGRFDGHPEHLISSVQAFTVGWRGEVYVADEGIRVFSPDGGTVRRIASVGQGPREVRTVIRMAVDDRGRLLASDLGNRRIAVFDTSGIILDHWPFPNGRPVYGQPAIVPIIGHQTLVGINPVLNPSGGPQGGFPRPIFLRLDSTGNTIDTVYSPARFGEKCTTQDDPHFSAGWWQDLREPDFPKLKWTAGTSGEVIMGCPSEYVVDRVQLDGTVIRISHLRDPVFEAREARDYVVETEERTSRMVGREWHWTGPRPPEKKPFYHKLLAGRSGRLWIWPGHPREKVRYPGPPAYDYWRNPKSGTFDLFDKDGRFLGPVLLPDGVEYSWHPGSGEPFFSGDTVWLVRTDSLGVEYIDRMLVRWER